MQTADTASTGTDTPDVESTPSTPSGSYPNTPSASSTWTNWPNPPNIGNNKIESGRPHTISSAYEKSHHSRPPLTSQLFEPPQQTVLENVGQPSGEQHDAGVVKRERPHSGSSMPYSRPSAAINKMQPVLPPLGPKPKSRAIAPPIVPPMGKLKNDPFFPEFLKETFLSLNLDMLTFANRDVSQNKVIKALTALLGRFSLSVTIALDKALFYTKKYLYFSYFSMKIYVVGTH